MHCYSAGFGSFVPTEQLTVSASFVFLPDEGPTLETLDFY